MLRSIKDIDVKVESTILPGNINFLLYDNKKEGHRILIFCDFEGLLWLGNSQEWDSDGTFDAAPGTLTKFEVVCSFVCISWNDSRSNVSFGLLFNGKKRSC